MLIIAYTAFLHSQSKSKFSRPSPCILAHKECTDNSNQKQVLFFIVTIFPILLAVGNLKVNHPSIDRAGDSKNEFLGNDRVQHPPVLGA